VNSLSRNFFFFLISGIHFAGGYDPGLDEGKSDGELLNRFYFLEICLTFIILFSIAF
jgi:hypothetical protein